MFQTAQVSMNQKDLYLFNKSASNDKQGTLVGNWWEERELKNVTDERRALTQKTFPKSHEDLFRNPPNEIECLKIRRENEKLDNTAIRVLGKKYNENYTSENHDYGKSKNKADELPKVGKRYQMLEKQYLEVIKDEMNNEEKILAEKNEMRYFDTISRSDFGVKPIEVERLGKRVMKTPNLADIDQDFRDEDFLVEHGLMKRTPILNEEELKKKVSNDPYHKQNPLTFYTEKMNEGCYYMSSQGENRNPFGLNNEFVKNFPHYKHYKN